MGLFSSSKRRASVAPVQQLQPPPRDALRFEDFEAEVQVSDLTADWSATRLRKQFEVFDIDGNGWLTREEFESSVRQLRALCGVLEDVKPAENDRLRAQVESLTTALAIASATKPEAKAEGHHDALLPPALKAWVPIAKTEAAQEAAVGVKELEAEFAQNPTGAAAEKLRAKTTELAAALRQVIDERVREDQIVARSDGVLQAGADAFTDVYDGVAKSINMTEEAGMKSMAAELSEERQAERVGRNGEEAKQTKSDVIEVYTDAAAARPLATAVVARIAAACGVTQPSKPVPLKSTVRILEKALLRPGDARGLCERVCDIVRDMVEGESAAQLAQLVRAFFDDDAIVVVRLKDRFKHPSGGGWRDIMVRAPRKRAPCTELPSRILPHIRRADHGRRATRHPPQINYYVASDANKHVCEVQLVHRSLLTARRGLPGHVIYGVVRNSTEVLEFLGLLSGQRGAGLLALVEDGWSPEAIERMGFVLAGGEDTVGVSEALVAKDWDVLAIERMGLPVTNEMRDARIEMLQEKGCDRDAILREGLALPFEGHIRDVLSVCVSPDGKHVVTGSSDRTARIWRLSDSSLVHTLEGHKSAVTSVCVTADGKHVVTASNDNTARIWLLSDGSLVHTLQGHTSFVNSVCVTAGYKQVVTGSDDKTARIWRLSDGSLVHTLHGHTSFVNSVCVTPDGTHVVTGSEDRTARIWRLSDGSHVRTLKGHKSDVYSVCVTPDGKHVVTGSWDKTARIWLLSNGSHVRTLEGHTNGVSSVFVTADGMRVVTASKDKTARVWLLSDGSLVRTLEGHTDTVSSVCVTADGKHVVTGSNDRTARIWLRVIPLARLRRPSVSVAVKVRCKTCGRV